MRDLNVGSGCIYLPLAIVLPLQDIGASCGYVLCASAGLIGRRLSLYIIVHRGKRPSPKAIS